MITPPPVIQPPRLEFAPARKHTRRNVLIGLGAGAVVVSGGITWWVRTLPAPAFVHSPYIYRGHSDFVTSVAWSPDGKRIASGCGDKTVQVWDAADGSNVYTYHGHADVVYAVAWSPDGKHIASGGYDKTVQVWAAQ